MARMQGAGAGDGRGSDKDKDKEGSSNKQSSRRNEPAEIRGLREAAKSSPSDSGVDRGNKDRPRIQREGGVRSRQDVMRERRMDVYGETRAQASRIGADDVTRSAANKAWRRAVQRKMDKGTLSDFDRGRWVSDYGTLKSRAQIRADYETQHFDSRAASAWNRGDIGDWAKFKAQSWGAEATSTFEDLKAAPLDTLADLTRNPLVAGALSLTGIGAGALAGLQLSDTALDVAQGEVTGGEALRTALADALDGGVVGEGLGIAKNLISAGLRNPDALPEIVSGQVGATLGSMGGARLASNMMQSNPLMGAAVAAAGPTIGKLGATQLLKSSLPPAKEAAKNVRPTAPPQSPLVTPKKDTRVAGAPKGSLERNLSENEALKEADALALVRQFQTERLGSLPSAPQAPQASQSGSATDSPLPYYNTFQPYRVT